MRLLPGYQHEYQGGMDTCTGRIWKDGAADITYDIGNLAGNHARALSQRPNVTWSKTQQLGSASFEVTLSDDNFLIVTVGGLANFALRATNNEMIADTLLMLMTYDVDRHMLQGCI
jgi:hypothetical protein